MPGLFEVLDVLFAAALVYFAYYCWNRASVTFKILKHEEEGGYLYLLWGEILAFLLFAVCALGVAFMVIAS
ncbi:MAG: hypothetical protein R3251_00615 [Candidatus Spechtbacterales bacterium]|nr:hypothetical protein [Candidatus Spechtbacterales bacterium]